MIQYEVTKSFSLSCEDTGDKDDWRFENQGGNQLTSIYMKMAAKKVYVCVCICDFTVVYILCFVHKKLTIGN